MESVVITTLLVGALAGLVIGVALTVAYVYTKGEPLIHRIHYKTWTLPCPACRDPETDEPTGEVTPESPVLRSMARQATESGELPTFQCSECQGSKKVHYEFPRLKPPIINKRQMVTGPIEKKLEKGSWIG